MPEAGMTAGSGAASDPGARVLRVPDGAASQRVDRFVADVTGLSRSHVQKLISAGNLTSDGVPLGRTRSSGAGHAASASSCRSRSRSTSRRRRRSSSRSSTRTPTC